MKFVVATIPGGTLAIPAGAAIVFIFAVSKVCPWLPAVIVLAAGAGLFFWLRIRLKQRAESGGSVVLASPSRLVIRDRTLPRASIRDVTWLDQSRAPVSFADVPDSQNRPSAGDSHQSWESSVSVSTVDGEPVVLAIQMQAGTAEQFAQELGRALGGVPVSGGRRSFKGD